MMNYYECFWRGQRRTIQADTTYKAQQAAQVEFGPKCKKRCDISVVLAQRAGKPVTHTATD